MSATEDFAANNAKYASTYDKGDLFIAPARKLIVVTCMDARIEPLAQLGFDLGDIHVIRNAGGAAREALRSIIISQRLLGTREVAVFHHTNCGMLTFTTEELRTKVKETSPGDETVAKAVNEINFLEITDLDESVKADVEFLRKNPLVLPETKITGWIHDVKTGKARRVV